MIRGLSYNMQIAILMLFYLVFSSLAGLSFYYAFSPNAKSSCKCETVKNNEVIK